MIESIQHETIRQQCQSINCLSGYHAHLVLFNKNEINPHVVKIIHNRKLIRLADPDLNVVIMQLAKLYQGAKSASINNFREG